MAPQPTNKALQAEIERLKAENARLTAASQAKLSIKTSPKGAVMVTGLGRWPTTLYREQWERLLGISDQIRQYIRDHAAELSVKGQE